jgi:hypothetical protein
MEKEKNKHTVFSLDGRTEYVSRAWGSGFHEIGK